MANDDFPKELERAYKRIEELERDNAFAQRDIRELKDKAWWRAYYAALTGLSTRSDLTTEQAHDHATFAADLAHGKRSQ